MTFTAPFTAVPGEIITAAGHNTSVRDNLNHLWGLFGGDPGAANKVPVSTGATTGAWGTIPDAALTDQKISQTTVPIATATASMTDGVYEIYAPSPGAPSSSEWYILNYRHKLNAGYAAQMAISFYNAGLVYVRVIVGGTPGSWYRMWSAGAMGSGSGLDADTLRTLIPGNANGNLAIANGTVVVNLNAYLLNGITNGNASGNIPMNNGTVNVNLNAQLLQGLVPGNSSGQIAIANGTLVANLNADKVDGYDVGHASGQIPVSDGTLNTNLNAQLHDGYTITQVFPLMSTYAGNNINGHPRSLAYSPTAGMIVHSSGTHWFLFVGFPTIRYTPGVPSGIEGGIDTANCFISGATFVTSATNGSNSTGSNYRYIFW